MIGGAARLLLIFLSPLILFPALMPARANYVLPYPSYMPGHRLYRLSRVMDDIKKYWYRGNITSVKYHLGLSDKYLVEAKTLFEYKQYLLATDALQRSTQQFNKISGLIKKAQEEGKDVDNFKSIIKNASEEHQRIFIDLIKIVPAELDWRPEKRQSSRLQLKNLLEDALKSRQAVENEN